MSQPGPSFLNRIQFRPNWRLLAGALLFIVALFGTVTALGAFLFRRPGPLDSLSTVLDSLARSLPTVGVIVVLVSILTVWRLRSSESTLLAQPQTDEIPPFAAPDGVAKQLRDTVQAQYRCEPDESIDRVHELLVDGAVRAIRTHRGVDLRTARTAVQSGTWTDDPVAGAFLADEAQYPLADRLYGYADPGGAYQRRVRRTLDAIDAIKRGDTMEANR